MNQPYERTPNIAIFADLENVAIGVREAKYGELDIGLVLERLLDKGNVIVKKAYCEWSNYASLKKPLHEASFELIEVPHVSYSGKNSADIRMVVDALDLCYSNEHVDLFAILTGDSDFSPLVSKLRENNKRVIGIGVKHTSSNLLVENCDEYIYYDDLVREKKKSSTSHRSKSSNRSKSSDKSSSPKSSGRSESGSSRRASKSSKASQASASSTSAPANAANTGANEDDSKKSAASKGGSKEEAIEIVLAQVEALFRERDSNVWASLVKQTLKRKRPHFSETFYGFRNFSHLLEEAKEQDLLELEKDEKSGGYIVLGFGPNA
ncbi:NYN domain-containing protein [Bradymonas sediminis]|uniref:NYN domain-containing protein n=1 Tax=Bradymonas sediminis TaxID=1548548 RepID=A0A2Z4FNH8_9DELT|nr:NYN domain-containing protein [Bradymonas sediminis]AWV90335.1 NYN domain-containing protein [Bradymonas sediminis]TDP75688.1 uncharacterized protein (TIGR00288 family) [Bradymonas sediminis]